MTNKVTKYGLMIIAAVLLVAMAFAGAGAATGGTPVHLTGNDLTNYKVLVVNDESGAVNQESAISLAGGKNVYLLEDVADWNTVALDEATYNKTVLIFNDTLDFNNGQSNMMVYNFAGKIYGNGKVIKNFRNATENTDNIGLIRFAGNGLYLNYVQMTNCTLETINNNCEVGFLIGDVLVDVNVKIVGCNVSNGCIVNVSDSVGGLVGYVNGASAKLTVNHSKVCNTKIKATAHGIGGILGNTRTGIVNLFNCTVSDCRLEITSEKVGGLVGLNQEKGSVIVISQCNVTNCSITGNGMVGGVIGRAATNYEQGFSSATLSGCNVKQCTILGRNADSVGGVCGRADDHTSIMNCGVEYCNITGSALKVGGIVGFAYNISISNCNVAHCNPISGDYYVGGLIGRLEMTNPSQISNSTIINSSIIGTGVASSKQLGGFIGSDINLGSDITNNTLKDVIVNVTGGSAEYVYLFDVSKYPIHSSNGVAKLAQISLANDNKIINSYVVNSSGVESTKLEGFSGLTSEFAINVSNPEITTIGSNDFQNTKLTGINGLDLITSIEDNAFRGSNLTGGFYIPAAATLGANVFTGTKLQAIYGDTTNLDIPDSVAKINITADGRLTGILTGSFAVKADNVFEDVILGSEPAKYFQNVSSDTTAYLFASESWNAGNAYLALATAGTVITLDSVEGPRSVPESVIALPGNKNLSDDITAPVKAGYTFRGWYNETTGGIIVINTTGKLNVSAESYTNAAGEWINSSSALTLYANRTVNQVEIVAENNVSIFGSNNVTAVKSSSVYSIILESVKNVTGTVTFTADNISVSDTLPTISGMNSPITVSIFDITADNDGSGTKSTIYLNVTFSDIADKDNIKFFHYSEGSGWDATPLMSSIVDVYTSENKVLYKVETTSFSPFGIGIYTALPPVYTPSSSSKQTGSTVILSEGQVAPTAYATATPTVAPTVKPTEKPATPTVIATAKPTTQATQQSPAPFVGILAGLGAAAVVLRLRK